MTTNKKPAYILCAAYDFALVLKIKKLRTFGITQSECAECPTKVILSDATRELMKTEPEVKPICPDCSDKLHERLGKPNYRMTLGQLREAAAMAAKIHAENN